jgi:hypothetical protein
MLMALLHNSGHTSAFIKLHEAIKREEAYNWLVEKVDDLCTQLADVKVADDKPVKQGEIT